jgi:SAM-dependent methyltransferase
VTHERADYHLAELRVAQDPADARHILPPLGPEHRRVLDVGCGAGQTLIASRLPAATFAVGIDPLLAAVTLGRSLDARLRLVCGAGETLPFASERFDFVYSRVALPYMRIDRALAEMARVLRPGGTVWLTLHPWSRVLQDTLAEARQLHARATLHGVYVLANGLLLHASGKQFAWPFGRGGYESFQTARSIRGALARAGFEDIVITKGRFFVVSAQRR